ncbi:major facilitator superfamily domain-containing protein [Mycena rosella]|uniref:Major facilitator superfamily domain-containing protein n=1 Tax=Mycena rosella TaxID=1033263 RepID=A0AAD7D4V6_MYCRO|nr:major facilitator superfamily domain-containing protein [Mycena rosella]
MVSSPPLVLVLRLHHGRPTFTPSPPLRSNLRGFAIAATCTAAMVVNVQLEQTSVAIALPTIGADLHARAAALQWLVSAYALSSGCLLLFCGHLADVHGRKRVFLAGSALLAAFTLGCGFAKDEVTLAVLRGFQGVGGAATIPAALGILAHEFPPTAPRSRNAAFASFAAGGPVGAAIGMILGGLVTQLSPITWRAQFFLSAAIALATLLAGALFLPADARSPPTNNDNTPPQHDTRTDWPGAVLSAVGLVLLVFVLGQADAPPDIISLLLLSLLLLALFAAWEVRLERRASGTPSLSPSPSPKRRGARAGVFAAVRRHRYARALAGYAPPPLVRPALFARARGRVGVVYGVALLQFAAFMVWAFWVQLYYQVYIGYSPVRTVVRLTPMFVTGLICNVFVALVIGRVPALWLLASGTLTTTLAPLLFALIVPSAPYWAFGFPAAVCSVVGTDFLFAAGTLFVAANVGPGEQSVAGGIFQTMTQLGTTFGVTASTIVFNHVQQEAAHSGADALGSYHAAMWTGVAFGGLATLFALVAFRGAGTIGKEAPQAEGATQSP